MAKLPRILVADDSPQIREFYRLLLPKLGCVPVTASSGAEALKYLTNSVEPFSLIVLDLLMPGQTGWETLLQIREMDSYKDVPVLVITGMELPEEQTRRLKQHCQSILLKSDFSLVRIRELLAELLPDRGVDADTGSGLAPKQV